MKVTIIGAGIVGLAVAHELASRGADVEIIDARGVARGATHASAGILAPLIEAHSAAFLSLALCSLSHYGAFIAGLSDRTGVRIEYSRRGSLQVARTERELSALQDRVARAPSLPGAGVTATLLDESDVRALEPNLARAAGAAYVEQHGFVHVGSLLGALEESLRRSGVRITRARVTAITAHGQVVLDDGPRSASPDMVIVAAGAWSAQIAGQEAIPVRPIRGQLVHLKLPEAPATRVIWGDGCYLVPWSDGTVLVGATSEDVGFDERSTAAGVSGLINHAIELVPSLAAASIESIRVGLRPATPDDRPIIGRSSVHPRIVYATGHYRSGVLLAPLTALLVADLVLEGRERPELDHVRPARHRL